MKTLDLEKITLLAGGHDAPADPNDPASIKACVMELVSYMAGEPWSAEPDCVSKVLGAFCRSWNDSMNDEDRNRLLKPLIPELIGTAKDDATEEKLAWMCGDWLVRVCAPAWLKLTPALVPHADALAALPELKDRASASEAQPKLAAARAAAWAALKPTVVTLQESALDLLKRMIAVAKGAQ